MKKLLLILLLAPTLIQAEEFNLVCEGETSVFNEIKLFAKYDKTHIITIKDSTLSMKVDNYIGDITYAGEHFEINKNEYIAWYTPEDTESTYPSTTININRMTGKIKFNLTQPWVNREANTKGNTYENFIGICRKAERKF